MNTLESLLLALRELPKNSRTRAHSLTCLHNRSVKRLTTVAAATQVLLAFFLLSRAQAGEIFVSNFVGGTIGEYDASTRATINPALVSGLRFPSGLALAGRNLFVAFLGHGTVGKYTTSGATVNASLISGVDGATDVVVSKGNLFVSSFNGNRIGKYTTTGATVDASFISVSVPLGMALPDGKLFVATDRAIGVSDAVTGATINSALVTGLFVPRFIAISRGDLFVSDNNGTVGVYDAATRAPIDPTLI